MTGRETATAVLLMDVALGKSRESEWLTAGLEESLPGIRTSRSGGFIVISVVIIELLTLTDALKQQV